MSAKPVWQNVVTGGGGGLTTGIVFSDAAPGIAYLRTDIGGLYRMNSDGSWTQLLDNVVKTSNWGHYGVDAVAADPTNADKVYCAVGQYTNSWDPNNGAILRSSDRGATWASTSLPFKVGANMPGRGIGERLAVDPKSGNIIYFGARSGKGLWKSTDSGVSWNQVTNFPNVGNFVQNPSDGTGYESDNQGIAFVTFDAWSGDTNGATLRLFVGVADKSKSIYMTNDAGATWIQLTGAPTGYIPHKGKMGTRERALYVTYCDGSGPDKGTTSGAVWRYDLTARTWKNITPPPAANEGAHGFGGIAVDQQNPGTIMVAALNLWWPDVLIWRSTNSGATWSPAWTWTNYPNRNKTYLIDNSNAPWIPTLDGENFSQKPLGWWVETLEINPFDSNHLLYGTGMTVFGSNNLTEWDKGQKITIKSVAKGIEETAVQALCCPLGGAYVFSSMGDVGGFQHKSLNDPPVARLPFFTTSTSVDWANGASKVIIRTGKATDGKAIQLAIIRDMDNGDWYLHRQASASWYGGQAVISADTKTIIWSTANSGVQISLSEGAWRKIADLPQGASLASDKVNPALFWAWSGTTLYRSTDTGSSWTRPWTSSKTISKVVVNPTVAGDVWISTLDGLYHSTNSGGSFVKIGTASPSSSPSAGWSFALGRSADTTRYGCNVYGYFTINGVTDLWMSVEAGFQPDNCRWYRMNDGKGWGNHTSNHVAASPDLPGRVFVGTNGRGVFHCENALPWAQ